MLDFGWLAGWLVGSFLLGPNYNSRCDDAHAHCDLLGLLDVKICYSFHSFVVLELSPLYLTRRSLFALLMDGWMAELSFSTHRARLSNKLRSGTQSHIREWLHFCYLHAHGLLTVTGVDGRTTDKRDDTCVQSLLPRCTDGLARNVKCGSIHVIGIDDRVKGSALFGIT